MCKILVSLTKNQSLAFYRTYASYIIYWSKPFAAFGMIESKGLIPCQTEQILAHPKFGMRRNDPTESGLFELEVWEWSVFVL